MSSLNLLQMQNGQKAFGRQVLFDDAAFAVNEGEHVGVIGPNGAGKSTLFRILIGQDELDGGAIVRSQQLSLGYLSQHDDWRPGETGNAYLERVSRLPLWQVKSMGRGLRVSEETLTQPVQSLSGGYRTRLKIMGLLGQDPNLLLLDEPTNYLDLETTLLLEGFLQSYQGAFLLISHDREFLRRTTDHILEVEAGQITKFNGHLDDYFEQKELLRSQLEAMAQSQAEKRRAVLDFVARYGAKASKARQAQSRLKSLEKMESVEIKAMPVTAAIQIPEPEHVGKTVMHLKDAAFGYGAKRILEKVSLEIRRGDHVAVVGLNGAGKSTLLKGLAGSLPPLQGHRELGYQVQLAIFNQHVVEVLDPQHTIQQSLEAAAHPAVSRQEILGMAGALLFSGDLIQKKIEVLSGGEKSRVALGRVLLQKAPCLLLDEPTNHLDFQTVEALTQALNRFTGTLIVVSHERSFIRRVGSKILEVSQGQVLTYPGTYDEYVWSLQRNLLADIEDEPVTMSTAKKDSAPPPKGPAVANAWLDRKERERRLRQLEKKIQQCEQEIQQLEAKNLILNEKVSAGDGDLSAMVSELSTQSARVQELEGQWLEMAEEREKLSEG